MQSQTAYFLIRGIFITLSHIEDVLETLLS